MSGFEVNGEGMSAHNVVCGSATLWKLYGASNNLVQENGAPAGWCMVSYNSLCSEISTICLPAIFSFFLLFLLLWKQLATRLSLVSCQKGAWRKAFFLEKLNFFQLEKTLWAAEKDARGGVLKSAQDFFENTVYSIGL